MRKDGLGGANTQTGIKFEENMDLVSRLKNVKDYRCEERSLGGYEIYFEDKLVAYSFKKHELYKYLKEKGVNWKENLSSQLLPDNAIFVPSNNTFFILEIKYQETNGSVDEKLQTCDFKLKQYKELFKSLECKVEFIYILNERFIKKPKYKDTLDYIQSVNCWYYIEYLPLREMGLPGIF
ncbi:hypothetical protein P740_005805 [Helicobacter pylori E48]|uniref:hypothetical protein n=1 Tax=Helicobacter pylori TaxID=210 RepID=UPI00041E025C|nr:hypothetical protein [Helicobacter pylori]NOK31164.1 hypothetical protein [Helicobacter pylori E48]